MLQFFKKSGRATNSDGKSSQQNNIEKRLSIEVPPDEIILDEHFVEANFEMNETRSRLSKNLNEIVLDKDCLCYFVQFLEGKQALSLIKFYLDAESFKAAAELSLTTPPNTSRTNIKCQRFTEDKQDAISDDIISSVQSTSFRENHKSTSSEGYDSLSFTSFDVCDRISISSQSENNLRETVDQKSDILVNVFNGKENSDDTEVDSKGEVFIRDGNKYVPNEMKKSYDFSSMRKPLTDDEKSQILCVETTKSRNSYPQEKQAFTNNSSTTDKINTTIATDAIRIYKKYLTSNSQYFIDIPATILSNISLALCAQEKDGQTISFIHSTCFEEAQNYVFERLEKEYVNEFLESEYFCKYCVDILCDGSLLLSDILYSESALFYFMEYLEQENKRNYLEFWISATNFCNHYKKNLETFNKKEAQNDAMVLYEKYFSLQASCPLRVSDSVRSRVEESICTEKDNETVVKCFDLPIKIIEKYIEERYFKNFLASQLFASYCNELRSKIKDHISSVLTPLQKRNSFKQNRHRKALSDCTSDSTHSIRNSFISQQNTLLAMESSKSFRVNSLLGGGGASTMANSKAGDMQIDSRQLTNPDLLWQRSNSMGGFNSGAGGSSLIFGRVDSLGRYERDFEMRSTTNDEKWSLATGGNKIKNAVRKLVNLPEDKVQEEIAWQIAEMIVKDITSVTLAKNIDINHSG